MITIEVGGIPYSGFTDASVNMDVKAVARSFSFSGSLRNDGSVPIKNGDKCKIYVETVPVINGFVEKLSVSGDKSSLTISLSGRSKTADLVDSHLYSNVNFAGGISLQSIARKLLDMFNMQDVKVISNVDIEPFTSSDLTSGSIGEKAFDFLEQYCRKRQVIITTDGDGNIVLTRASENRIKTKLLNIPDSGSQGNILNFSVSFDYTKRFNKYIFLSQTNNSVDPAVYDKIFLNGQKNVAAVSAKTNIQNLAYDDSIRNSRIYAKIADSSSNNKTLGESAIWEKNVREGESFNYTATVSGFKADLDGFIWQPNYLVSVIDKFCDIESDLLIKAVNFEISSNELKTTLSLVPPKAFTTIQGKKQKKHKKGKKKGDSFNDAAFGL